MKALLFTVALAIGSVSFADEKNPVLSDLIGHWIHPEIPGGTAEFTATEFILHFPGETPVVEPLDCYEKTVSGGANSYPYVLAIPYGSAMMRFIDINTIEMHSPDGDTTTLSRQ